MVKTCRTKIISSSFGRFHLIIFSFVLVARILLYKLKMRGLLTKIYHKLTTERDFVKKFVVSSAVKSLKEALHILFATSNDAVYLK